MKRQYRRPRTNSALDSVNRPWRRERRRVRRQLRAWMPRIAWW